MSKSKGVSRKAAVRYHYKVINASGGIVALTGADYRAAVAYAKAREGCGLHYGLQVRRYAVPADAQRVTL